MVRALVIQLVIANFVLEAKVGVVLVVVAMTALGNVLLSINRVHPLQSRGTMVILSIGVSIIRLTVLRKTLMQTHIQLWKIGFSGDFCGLGWGGRIRTDDQRINSPLRYHCATPQ